MNHILQIVAVYLAEFIFGSAFLLPFYPHAVIGKSFARFYTGFIALFFALFLLCLWRLQQFSINHVLIFLLASWIFVMACTQTLTKLEEFLRILFAGIGFIWAMIYFKKFSLPDETLWTATPKMAGFVFSMLFLSAHLMTMIFGHWYLVNRKLPIQHLVKNCFYLMVITIIRIFASGLAVYFAYANMQPEMWLRLTDFMGHGVFFWSRFLAGLFVPTLVSVLAYQSAKIGSNQSATGILYAGCVFVLMGEFLALYLFVLTGYFF